MVNHQQHAFDQEENQLGNMKCIDLEAAHTQYRPHGDRLDIGSSPLCWLTLTHNFSFFSRGSRFDRVSGTEVKMGMFSISECEIKTKDAVALLVSTTLHTTRQKRGGYLILTEGYAVYRQRYRTQQQVLCRSCPPPPIRQRKCGQA